MNDKPKHTPTPWTAGSLNPMTNRLSIFQEYKDVRFTSTNGIGHKTIAHCINKNGNDAEANAAFIVRACNSHEKLLEALKDCLLFLENDAQEWNLTCDPEIEKAKAAIAEAEKEGN